MPDAPDGYRYRIESPRHALSDMAELAVRLGSVVSYHRSGTVIFADGMEHGTAPYYEQISGTGSAILPVTSPTFQGGLSLKCTAGSDANETSGILKRMQPVILGRVGLEGTWSFDTVCEAFKLQIQHNTGAVKRTYGIKIDPVNDIIKYRNENNVWTTVQSYVTTTGDKYLFHVAKLVVDLVTGEYCTLYLDQSTIDLSGLLPRYGVDVTMARLEFGLEINSRTGENDIGYIDNMIITTDEP